MKKKILLCSLAIILLIAVYLLLQKKQPTATIDGHLFITEIAKTPKEQEIGLAKYTTLPINRAMYFPFAKPDYYRFWMKGMRFPIDILFLRNEKIVTIIHSAPMPDRVDLPIYQPTTPSDGVLEINAGLSEKYGFKVGNTVTLTE